MDNILTIPVTTVACELSFSALRHLKLWTRYTMSEDRLNVLAILLLHRGTNCVPKPVDIYNSKYNWRNSLKQLNN